MTILIHNLINQWNILSKILRILCQFISFVWSGGWQWQMVLEAWNYIAFYVATLIFTTLISNSFLHHLSIIGWKF